jgi:hypothetical protein
MEYCRGLRQGRGPTRPPNPPREIQPLRSLGKWKGADTDPHANMIRPPLRSPAGTAGKSCQRQAKYSLGSDNYRLVHTTECPGSTTTDSTSVRSYRS